MAHYALLQVDDGTASGRRLVFAQMMADLHRPQIAEGCPGAGMLGIRPPNRRADMCFLALTGFTPPRSRGAVLMMGLNISGTKASSRHHQHLRSGRQLRRAGKAIQIVAAVRLHDGPPRSIRDISQRNGPPGAAMRSDPSPRPGYQDKEVNSRYRPPPQTHPSFSCLVQCRPPSVPVEQCRP